MLLSDILFKETFLSKILGAFNSKWNRRSYSKNIWIFNEIKKKSQKKLTKNSTRKSSRSLVRSFKILQKFCTALYLRLRLKLSKDLKKSKAPLDEHSYLCIVEKFPEKNGHMPKQPRDFWIISFHTTFLIVFKNRDNL